MDVRTGRIYPNEAAAVAVLGENAVKSGRVKAMDVEPTTIQRLRMRVGRNHLCPCGSGKKFKKCCRE